MLSINTVQSNPINTNPEGYIKGVCIDLRGVLWVMLSINTVQLNPINTDPEGSIESVCIDNRLSRGSCYQQTLFSQTPLIRTLKGP